MPAPILFVSRLRIAEGRRGAFEDAYRSAIGSIERDKPRTALYAAYWEASGSTVRIVHAFPDAAAMITHFEGSDERTRSVSDLMTPAGFAVYGRAPVAAINQLGHEASTTSASLELVVDPIGGFLRAPV
jgi:hypothetical protein